MARHSRPRAFVLENVSNLVRMEGGRVMALICAELSAAGYEVELALDVNVHSNTTPYISLAILYTEYTGWRQNDFGVHA